MKTDQILLQILVIINRISNDKKLGFNQKIDRILQEIVSCMKAESGSIMLMKGRKYLEVMASTNDQLIGIKQSLEDQTPSSWVAKNKSLLYIDDIAKHEFFQKRYDHYRREAFLLAPIISRNKLLGIISVTDKIEEDVFSKEEQTVLLNIAGQIISALENQRLSESLKKKTRALQKKNRELKKLERLKTDLFNMLIHDLKGPISEIMANLFDADYLMKHELVFIGSPETVAAKIHAASKAGLFNVFMGEFNFADLPEAERTPAIPDVYVALLRVGIIEEFAGVPEATLFDVLVHRSRQGDRK